jgi:hypothetical protein
MEYVVTKTALRGRQPGAKFTEKELLDAGANIQKYLESGKLKKADACIKSTYTSSKRNTSSKARSTSAEGRT